MKRRKGFTLIEILAVVVLIGVIAVIGTISVTRLITRSREKAYEEQINNIELAAKTWATKNASLLAADGNYSVYVTIENLKVDGLLENKPITDPRTDDELDGCVQVTYNNESKKYDYEYITDCNKSDSEYPTIKVSGKNYIEVTQNSDAYDYNQYIDVIAYDSDGNIFSGSNPNYKIEGPTITKNGVVVNEIIPNKVGEEYLLAYKAIDVDKGLVSYATIKLRVVDTTAPTLLLNNIVKNKVIDYETILINNNYDYPVLTASDNSNETIKIKRSGTVTTTKVGDYKIIYTASDSSKNKATYTINVSVKAPQSLKFDLVASTPDGDNNWYKSSAKIIINNLKFNDKILTIGTDAKCSYQIDNTTAVNLTTNSFDVSKNGLNVVVKVTCTATVDKETITAQNRISLKIDTKAPTCSVTSNYTGWTTQDVILTGECKDTNGSGCLNESISKKFSTDASGITNVAETPGVVKDNAGNETTCGKVLVQIDKQAPTCAVTSNYTGWTNKDVTVTGTCNDGSGSGCDITKVSQIYTTSGVINEEKQPGTHNRTGEEGSYNVRDKAGNVTPCGTLLVQIDKTAPTCTVNGGSDSWTNEDVTVTGTCSDTGSGCTGTNPSYKVSVATGSSYTKTAVGPGASGGTATVIDAAGNSATCAADQTVMIDKKPPTCSVKSTYQGGLLNLETKDYDGSWINKDVTVTGTCSDTGGSGCASENPNYKVSTLLGVISKTDVGPGPNGIETKVFDNAGNSAICAANQTVKIDKQSPKCVVTIKGKTTGDEYSGGLLSGWIGEPVTVTGTCDDKSGSGCTTSTQFSQTVDNYDVGFLGVIRKLDIGTYTDKAGNSVDCGKYMKVDSTPPTCSVSATNADGTTHSGTTTQNVTVTGKCSDNISGCKDSSISKTITNTNNSGVSPGYVYDKAGNEYECPTTTVRISKSAPTCKVTATTSDGKTYTGGWTNKTVTIKRECVASGSVGCTGTLSNIVIDSNTNSSSYDLGEFTATNGVSVDCGTMAIKVDKSAPTCAISAKTEDGKSYTGAWTNKNVTITGKCSDIGGSGCKTSEYTYETEIEEEDAINQYMGPGSNGNSVYIYDNAGNSVSCGKNQLVRIDRISPTCAISASPNAIQDISGFHKTSSGITLQPYVNDFEELGVTYTSTDAHSGINNSATTHSSSISGNTESLVEYKVYSVTQTIVDNALNSTTCSNDFYMLNSYVGQRIPIIGSNSSTGVTIYNYTGRRGDIDENSQINYQDYEDAEGILEGVAGLGTIYPEQYFSVDTNVDYKITATDARLILQTRINANTKDASVLPSKYCKASLSSGSCPTSISSYTCGTSNKINELSSGLTRCFRVQYNDGTYSVPLKVILGSFPSV